VSPHAIFVKPIDSESAGKADCVDIEAVLELRKGVRGSEGVRVAAAAEAIAVTE
jgi:hypothetical protein